MTDDEGLPGGVRLAEAIQALREELGAAMAAAPTEGVRFRPASVELSVQTAVTKSVGGKAGIKWWLIDAGGEASRETVVTQTLTLSLSPVYPAEGEEVLDGSVAGVEESSGSRPAVEDAPLGDTE